MTEFRTVPTDLAHVANRAEQYFRGRGFRIEVEPYDLAYPFTPALRLKRGQTTVIVEVDGTADMRRLTQWAAFCRSQTSDHQIALAVPPEAPRHEWDGALRTAGVGLFICEEAPFEALAAQDLSLNLTLPDLSLHPARVRTALGEAYDAFDRQMWRECFKKGSAALEAAARRALKRELLAGSAVIPKKGGEVVAAPEVTRMTMGQLAGAYRRIKNPSKRQQIVGAALKTVYADRNLATHHEGTSAAERKLRQNVGNDMWVIVNALVELHRRP
jgi:hypothetical protein